MSYRMQLMSHVRDVQSGFSEYNSPFPMQLFSRSDVPDDILYFVTKLWRDTVAMRYELRNSHRKISEEGSGSDEFLDLIPYTTRHGDVLFYNRMKGDIVAGLYRQPNGVYSYRGLASYLTKLGGRGELDTIFKRVEDGQYFSDRKIH